MLVVMNRHATIFMKCCFNVKKVQVCVKNALKTGWRMQDFSFF